MKIKRLKNGLFLLITGLLVMSTINSCDSDEDTLAPYTGSPKMSGLVVENKSFTPRVTWLGGYVTVFGVNKGAEVRLDSTLVWLIYKENNGITYPVKYGETKSGVQDRTSQYGGSHLSELFEDSLYTIWVMKADIWGVVSNNQGKIIKADSLIAGDYAIDSDTLRLSASLHTQKTLNLDNYINIFEISTFGRLGVLSILQTDVSDDINISWTVNQAGVTDTMIAAIGISEGNQYSSANSKWELYSEVDEGGQLLYGKHNVISAPLISGTQVQNTKAFVEYPEKGLERNKTYYIWIANKEWDGVNRLRATPYYAYGTFRTR